MKSKQNKAALGGKKGKCVRLRVDDLSQALDPALPQSTSVYHWTLAAKAHRFPLHLTQLKFTHIYGHVICNI